jgi:flavin reductase (DIM6/NTAB) family NADH-FMN oxidoreductase RutF
VSSWQSPSISVHSANRFGYSNRFAKRLTIKWEGMSRTQGTSLAPLLSGAAAMFESIPCAKHDAGDLRSFIAEVKRFHMSVDRYPLVFSKGRYASLQPTEFAAPLWPLDIHS